LFFLNAGKRSPLKVVTLKADNKLLVSCLDLDKPGEEPKNVDLDVSEFSSGTASEGESLPSSSNLPKASF
jgi:hypothetical protein